MTSRRLRLTWNPIFARYVTEWTFVLMGVLFSATGASGQVESPHGAVTEIWMSGDDLTVVRRIPQDRHSVQHSYDEVARSMIDVAEARYQRGDNEAAESLEQWARELSAGRIGNDTRIASRLPKFGEMAGPSWTEPKTRENVHFPSSLVDLEPLESEIEWPVSRYADKSTADDTQHSDYKSKSEPVREVQQQVASRETTWEKESRGKHATSEAAGREDTLSERHAGSEAATSAKSSTQLVSISDLVVNQHEKAGWQLALVPANVNQGLATSPDRDLPTVLTEWPTMLALSCFAAGVVCCFVLHTLLLLTPVRFTVFRTNESPSRTPDDLSAAAKRTGDPVESQQRESFPRRPHTPTRDFAEERNKGSSMVEEFYNSNIELFEKFSQSIE